ncbi:MAG: Uncharacterised protein [Bacteroidota bacterium]|nr:MAG: Uncharacterised protein [Bacteroidota bacterium]
MFSKKAITLPIALKSFVIPFPIELNRTPKSISSFSGFFGVDVLIIVVFVSLLALQAERRFLGFILFEIIY